MMVAGADVKPDESGLTPWNHDGCDDMPSFDDKNTSLSKDPIVLKSTEFATLL